MLDCQEKLDDPAKSEKPAKAQPKLIGFTKQLEARQDAQRPDSIVARKMAVLIVIGLITYVGYAFIWRVCVPMIHQNAKRRGSRTQGIVLLVFFVILWLMFCWSYLVIITTPPGYVKDHVQVSAEPRWNAQEGRFDDNPGTSQSSLIAGPAYPTPARPEHAHLQNTHAPDLQAGPQSFAAGLPATLEGALGSIAPPSSAATPEEKPARTGPQRKIPEHAVLSPPARYCYKCQRIKPYRAHHCRHCGQCVLGMDHHCPWIGQCAGARNKKYFMNFLQWAAIFTTYTFLASLLAAVPPHRPAGASHTADPQQFVLIGIAGFFMIFTVGMAGAHTRLQLFNITTIEEIGITRMRRRERAATTLEYGLCSFGKKAKLVDEWDHEWGRLDKEGNIWWMGSARANWEAIMGTSKLGWFLPIKPTNRPDGLSYPVNPRFTPDGRWQRRADWPQQLQ
ncbi:uncharacterized protein L969DRAFT_91747 [Mixia osmundae IAM 14324]|uniref:Palmitoyltransferase n=1 Tax=Mixia osmundae (strain CBS 9802 / IAM 14324 / JCM 22182 / KY 12970) TaxID=764103 RepID=G7EAE4_MIXOS|nr:uncharacterized protein L969DRAFT_91747 [Mixia osmundae IAM 14324]KEI42294.1 hypothetical protein L969DRAFT_91747 [Mixia osmundae IAM 14324]GAA99804.1 hypothetical protein E5Q_06507 [Mixia osmundae IAM 14324]